MRQVKHIDASIGAPIAAFKQAAEYALEQSMSDMNQYDDYGEIEHNMARNIMDFFDKELEIKRKGWSGVGLDGYAYTNGVTDGYSTMLEILAQEANDYIRITQQDLKPAIIMPVPTYGLFYHQPEKLGLEILELEREADGSVSPEKLRELLLKVHKEKKYLVSAYYDSNPNNPTGHIRDKEETSVLADIFIKYNHYMKAIKEEELKKLSKADRKKRPKKKNKKKDKSEFDFDFAPPSKDYSKLKDISPTIKLFDDMIYLGLEHSKRKPYPFMGFKELSEDTFLLAGGSKIGLTALRTGIMIGAPNYVKKFKGEKKRSQYFPNTMSMHALTPVFPSTPEHQTMRNKHLKNMNKRHWFSGQLMKALINGIDTIDVSKSDRKRMVSLLASINKMSLKSAEERLKEGLSGINVITEPQAGFFHLLDYSALKGFLIKHYVTTYGQYSTRKITSERDIYWANRDLSFGMCSGANCGYQEDSLIFRATFAMAPRDIIKFVGRIETMMTDYVRPLQNVYPPKPNSL